MEHPVFIHPGAVTDTKPLHPGPPQVTACGDLFLGGAPRGATHWFFDGFNLYHSLLACEPAAGRPLRWLNLAELAKQCSHLVSPGAYPAKLSFYTSIPHHLREMDAGKVSRHQAYLRALTAWRPACEVVLGHFQPRQAGGRRYWTEKGTDVSLALGVVRACLGREVDHVVIVSGDADLQPVAKLVTECFKHISLHFAFPAHRANRSLRNGHKVFTLTPLHYASAQFPAEVQLPSGRTLHQPHVWRAS